MAVEVSEGPTVELVMELASEVSIHSNHHVPQDKTNSSVIEKKLEFMAAVGLVPPVVLEEIHRRQMMCRAELGNWWERLHSPDFCLVDREPYSSGILPSSEAASFLQQLAPGDKQSEHQPQSSLLDNQSEYSMISTPASISPPLELTTISDQYTVTAALLEQTNHSSSIQFSTPLSSLP